MLLALCASILLQAQESKPSAGLPAMMLDEQEGQEKAKPPAGPSVGIDDPRNSSLTGIAPTATNAPRLVNIAPYAYTRYDFGGGFAIGAEAIFWATDYLTVESGRANRYSLFVTFAF